MCRPWRLNHHGAAAPGGLEIPCAKGIIEGASRTSYVGCMGWLQYVGRAAPGLAPTTQLCPLAWLARPNCTRNTTSPGGCCAIGAPRSEPSSPTHPWGSRWRPCPLLRSGSLLRKRRRAMRPRSKIARQKAQHEQGGRTLGHFSAQKTGSHFGHTNVPCQHARLRSLPECQATKMVTAAACAGGAAARSPRILSWCAAWGDAAGLLWQQLQGRRPYHPGFCMHIHHLPAYTPYICTTGTEVDRTAGDCQAGPSSTNAVGYGLPRPYPAAPGHISRWGFSAGHSCWARTPSARQLRGFSTQLAHPGVAPTVAPATPTHPAPAHPEAPSSGGSSAGSSTSQEADTLGAHSPEAPSAGPPSTPEARRGAGEEPVGRDSAATASHAAREEEARQKRWDEEDDAERLASTGGELQRGRAGSAIFYNLQT